MQDCNTKLFATFETAIQWEDLKKMFVSSCQHHWWKVLKRWNYSGHKDRRLVDIPLENLSLKKYVEGYKPDSYMYDLYGVCNHLGIVGGGHYTANVKNASNKWYNYNDLILKEIKKENVVTNEAYCLFFRKKK